LNERLHANGISLEQKTRFEISGPLTFHGQMMWPSFWNVCTTLGQKDLFANVWQFICYYSTLTKWPA